MGTAKRALGLWGGREAVSMINNLFLDAMPEGVVMAAGAGGGLTVPSQSCLSLGPTLPPSLPSPPCSSGALLWSGACACLGGHLSACIQWGASGLTGAVAAPSPSLCGPRR